MAQQVSYRILGVDVSKQQLELFEWDTEVSYSIANEPAAIAGWLAQQSGRLRLALEPTNHYHLSLAEAAHELGHEVFLVDPYRLEHYRESVGGRAKTDPLDGQLLARYLAHEAKALRRWQPLSPAEKRLWRLLRRRAKLVSSKTQLRQSLADVPELDLQRLLSSLERAIRELEAAMRALVKQLGWQAQVRRCQALPGVGSLTALGLVAAYHRGEFSSAEQFIAFLGLDVRACDSGTFLGQRKLSKKGEPELRRLLYNAAMAGRRHPRWEPYYLNLRGRGLSTTAAFMALGRKLARVAFALLRSGTEFNPERHKGGCVAT